MAADPPAMTATELRRCFPRLYELVFPFPVVAELRFDISAAAAAVLAVDFIGFKATRV